MTLGIITRIQTLTQVMHHITLYSPHDALIEQNILGFIRIVIFYEA
jgi:hypothetical protein